MNALHANRLDTRLRRNDDAMLVRALGDGCRQLPGSPTRAKKPGQLASTTGTVMWRRM